MSPTYCSHGSHMPPNNGLHPPTGTQASTRNVCTLLKAGSLSWTGGSIFSILAWMGLIETTIAIVALAFWCLGSGILGIVTVQQPSNVHKRYALSRTDVLLACLLAGTCMLVIREVIFHDISFSTLCLIFVPLSYAAGWAIARIYKGRLYSTR